MLTVIRLAAVVVGLAAFAPLLAACTRQSEAFGAIYRLPTEGDWLDHGLIFEAGEAGQWDAYLYGGFTATVVTRNGRTFLYYQGASGYRTEPDETVTGRAIGLATSEDGLTFAKAAENPVLTWFPTRENGEEGATSGAAALDGAGNVVLFYGANSEKSATLVSADGRLAIAADGIHFTDQGIVLDHLDRDVWASGDELFPIMAIHDADQWYVYYLPNGGLAQRQLGVAWGPAPDRLTHSSAVRSGLGRIRAWGTAGYGRIGDGVYAAFLNDVTQRTLEVRLLDLDAPNRMSAPVQTYRFDHVAQATVRLDEADQTWYLYYRTEGGYGVMTAPAEKVES